MAILGKGDSPQLALDNFDSKRLTFARELRKLTKKELAAKIDRTPSAISQFESGTLKPDIETFMRLSFVLSVPTTFFMGISSKISDISIDECHFRSRQSVSRIQKKQSIRIGQIYISLIEFFEKQGIVFPKFDSEIYQYEINDIDDIEQATLFLRKQWGLGLGPIPNLIKLVESKGVFVLPSTSCCREVDAFSTWAGSNPAMVLVLHDTPSRVRFDIGHELGHIFIHDDIETGDSHTEKQAQRFSGAFLAPRDTFILECPRKWNYNAFLKLKSRWKMSVQALLFRAKDLDCISQASYRKAMIDMAKFRTHEENEFEKEQPTLFSQAIKLLLHKITLQDIASYLNIAIDELKYYLEPCVSPELVESISKDSGNDYNMVKLIQ